MLVHEVDVGNLDGRDREASRVRGGSGGIGSRRIRSASGPADGNVQTRRPGTLDLRDDCCFRGVEPSYDHLTYTRPRHHSLSLLTARVTSTSRLNTHITLPLLLQHLGCGAVGDRQQRPSQDRLLTSFITCGLSPASFSRQRSVCGEIEIAGSRTSKKSQDSPARAPLDTAPHVLPVTRVSNVCRPLKHRHPQQQPPAEARTRLR